MAKYKVVVTDDRHGGYQEEKNVLEPMGAEVVVTHCTTPEEVIAATRDADGVLVNLAPMPAEVIDSLQKCKAISRYGVGYDNVDVAAATRKKIYVTNVPDYCAEDVSDHAIALLFSCLRKTVKVDGLVRGGQWNITPKEKIFRVKGKKYGLIAYGLIAKAVHRKLKGFDLAEFLIYDPFVDAKAIEAAGGRKVELNELCREADFISIHAPLGPKTRGMIGKEQFALMKPTSILINVSRGPVVDEAALLDALQTGKIMALGTDVFAEEPPRKDHPLFKMSQVVVTDHAGWFTLESMVELKTKAAQNVASVLAGGKPAYPVNSL